MDDPDTLVVIASHLRPAEAAMLRGLLESAGILAVTRDEMLSSVHPFLQPIIGGAKVAVRLVDAELAGDIVHAAGVLPGSPDDESVDIPDEEWSRTPAPQPPVFPSDRSWPRWLIAWWRRRLR